MKNWKVLLVILLLLILASWALAKSVNAARARQQLDDAQTQLLETQGLLEMEVMHSKELASTIPTLKSTIEALEKANLGLKVEAAAKMQTVTRTVSIPCGEPETVIVKGDPVEVVRTVEVPVPGDTVEVTRWRPVDVSARTEAMAVMTEMGNLYFDGMTEVLLDGGEGWEERVQLGMDSDNSSVGVSSEVAERLRRGGPQPEWDIRLGVGTDDTARLGVDWTARGGRWGAYVEGNYRWEPEHLPGPPGPTGAPGPPVLDDRWVAAGGLQWSSRP